MRFLLHSRQFSTDKQPAHLRLEESNTSPVHIVRSRSTDVYCACLIDATVCVQEHTLPTHTASVQFQIFVPTQNRSSHKTSQSPAVTPNQLKFHSPISRIKAYSFLHFSAPTRISATQALSRRSESKPTLLILCFEAHRSTQIRFHKRVKINTTLHTIGSRGQGQFKLCVRNQSNTQRIKARPHPSPRAPGSRFTDQLKFACANESKPTPRSPTNTCVCSNKHIPFVYATHSTPEFQVTTLHSRTQAHDR